MAQFTDEAWRSAAENLTRGIVFLQSTKVLTEATEASLASAVADAILRLDNEQTDAVESMGDSPPPAYTDTSSEVGLGELQRLKKLRDTLLGDKGLIETLKNLDPPQGTTE